MKSTIISSAALATLAAAAPMAANTTKTLPGVFYINGQRVDSGANPTALKGPCTADDDVLTCAKKTAALWQMSSTGGSEVNHMTLQNICEFNNDQTQQYECQIDFDYHIGFTGCHLSDPVITDHQDVFDCNSDGGCKQSFTFSTSTTQMDMYGMHIGTSLQAGVNIGFFSAQASVTADWMQTWGASVTNSTSATREYDMTPGDVCAPTTVQFNVECTAGMVIDNAGFAKLTVTGDPNNHPTEFYPCGGSDLVQVTGGNDIDKYNAVCQALKPSGISMDVASIGGGTAWSIEGCMAS